MICKRMSRSQEELLFKSMAPDPRRLGAQDIPALMSKATEQGLKQEFRQWLAVRVGLDVCFTVRSWCED